MRATLVFCAAMLFAAIGAAQVTPSNPTAHDTVVYNVLFPALCGGEPITTAQVDGFHIDVTSTMLGGPICLSVLVTGRVTLGPLRPGTYTVTVRRTFVGQTITYTDSFVVSAAAPIPALDRGALLALFVVLGAVGVLAVRR